MVEEFVCLKMNDMIIQLFWSVGTSGILQQDIIPIPFFLLPRVHATASSPQQANATIMGICQKRLPFPFLPLPVSSLYHLIKMFMND